MKRSLRSWLWRVPLDQEVDEELAFHVEMRTRELVERGMHPIAARQEALRRLGDLARVKQTCLELGRKRDREMRLTQWLEEFRDDVRIALRQMRHSPAFAIIAAVTLALGIGANSAIFALVDATLLSPLPFPTPDRLVMVWEKTDTIARSRVSPLNMADWQERSQTFEAIGGFVPSIGGMVLAGADGTSETHPRQWVTAQFFDALGVKPIVGRTFNADDDRQRANAVVLSETLWRARFNGDPGIVGRDIRLDGMPFTVVGVVPRDFQFFGRTSMWGLIAIVRRPEARRAYVLQAVGRMKPGVSLDAASADLGAVAGGLAREFPESNTGRGVALEPMHDALIGSELRLTSMLFLGVVGIVLLICCANVANLLLARATVRTRELAVRSALGAGRRRIIRQLMTESLVLSVVAGALAMAIGAAILNVAPLVIPEGLLPTAVTLTFDARVVAFCAAAAVFVGLLFGLAPAWQATAASSTQALASDSRTVTGRGGALRNLLVVGEVATAVLLLFGAGLLLRTLIAVEKVDRGYRARQVLTMMVDPIGSRYPTAPLLQQFYDDIEREIMGVPGVRAIGWASTLPLGPSHAGRSFFDIVGAPPVDESKRSSADYQIVSPSYFRALDLPIVGGRPFDERDRRDSVPVCIVNEAFVRQHLQGRTPIGEQIALRPTGSPQAKPDVREIVGVARQVKERPDEVEDLLQVYVPMAQDLIDDMYLVVASTSLDAEALAGPVRAAIGRVDREQLVSVRDVMTLEDIAWDATARHRFRAALVITFATLALVLAMVGVFGILAYSVQQRVREFGVRIAMGATMADMLGLVLGSAARVIAVGAVIGLASAAVLSRSLSSVLFGVQPLDALTFASVAIVLLVTALIATAGPAWRAARTDPAVTLRGE
jgi:putative ABC transport system permease protein